MKLAQSAMTCVVLAFFGVFAFMPPGEVKAGSPYPGYTIDRLEIINDGATELAILCHGQVFEVGWPDHLKGNCVLQFARKTTWNWILRWSGVPQWFHTLHATGGF